MKARGISLLAVALVALGACGRGEDKTGQTTTTSGETEAERERQMEHPVMPPPPLPQGMTGTQEPSAPGPALAETETDKAKAKAEADAIAATEAAKKAHAQATKTKVGKKKLMTTGVASQTKPGDRGKLDAKSRSDVDNEPIGSAETTAAEVEGAAKAPASTEPTTPPSPTGATTPVPAPEEPYVNHSTVLGDGKSGMYTDGQGTYGGRATWGTGAKP